jgi:hypothetical chaperone protein
VFERYIEVIRRQSGHLIAARVEQAKIDLSRNNTVKIDLTDTLPGLTVDADKALFDASIGLELERLEHAVAATLRASGRPGSAITTVFLTGGTSAVPAVKQMLAEALPRARAIEGDLFNSVGFGLALEAKRRFGSSARSKRAVG